MANSNSSIVSRVVKAWMGYKAGKGAIRLLSGPVVLSGIGYFLYRHFNRPSLGGAI